jgi:hypothetical protein
MSQNQKYFFGFIHFNNANIGPRFITVVGVIGLLAQYVAVPFFTDKLKLHDSTISLMDTATNCINQFILAFATAEWMVKRCFGAMFLSTSKLKTVKYRQSICILKNNIGN